MSHKMVFKVMMSAFWRKSCDPQRPSLIRKIPFPRIGFFRENILRCGPGKNWFGGFYGCVLTGLPAFLLAGISRRAFFCFYPSFCWGWDVSNMAFLTALVIVACVPWPNGIRRIFFMLNHEQISNWSQQLTFSYRDSEIHHGHSPCRLVWSFFLKVSHVMRWPGTCEGSHENAFWNISE